MCPVLFKLGSFAVYSYGPVLALAVLLGLYFALQEARRKGIGEEKIETLVIYLLIAGIIGARFYYVIFNLDYYLTHPGEIFLIRHGGLAIHGGIIAGITTIIYFSRRWKINFWKLADTLTPSLILAQALGRAGCFLSGCCYGLPTNLPWGITFPPGSPGALASPSQALHPTQLYELLINAVIFAWIYRRRGRISYDGELFLAYLLLHFSGRYLVELFRGDSLYLWGTSLKAAELVSGLMIIAALLFRKYLKGKNKIG